MRYPYAHRYPPNVYATGAGVPIRGPYPPYFHPAYFYPQYPVGYFAPHPPRPSPPHHFTQGPVVESTTMANVEPPKLQPLAETSTEKVTAQTPDEYPGVGRTGQRTSTSMGKVTSEKPDEFYV